MLPYALSCVALALVSHYWLLLLRMYTTTRSVTRSATRDTQVLGKGSFGKVMLVKRKDDDGGVYAMKTLKKKTLFQRNQVT